MQQDTPLMPAEIMSSSSLTRDEVRHLVYHLNALGVSLLLKEGRVAARPGGNGEPLPIEALTLLRAHKADLLVYLTTPPADTRPCAACGRSVQWTLDPVGIWVCDCYFHPELHTWPDLEKKKG
jgi:hypothetical protein